MTCTTHLLSWLLWQQRESLQLFSSNTFHALDIVAPHTGHCGATQEFFNYVVDHNDKISWHPAQQLILVLKFLDSLPISTSATLIIHIGCGKTLTWAVKARHDPKLQNAGTTHEEGLPYVRSLEVSAEYCWISRNQELKANFEWRNLYNLKAIISVPNYQNTAFPAHRTSTGMLWWLPQRSSKL
jgi:hypothetical protein